MSKPNATREVICLWHGNYWHTENIACPSEIREDLPRSIAVGYGDATLIFVLSGFIGETPAYRQQS